MANKAGNLGREGEQGVVNHLNKWIDRPKLYGVERARSKGINDVGDLTNVPLTTIECKNYGRISLTSLINNARGKAIASEKPVWWLTIKKRGRSAKNSGHWFAATDLLGLIDALQLDLSDEELDDLQDPKQYTYTIKLIGDLSSEYGKRFKCADIRWSVMIVGDGRTANALDAVAHTHAWFDENYDEIAAEEEVDLIIPVTLVRSAGATIEDLESWYAVTTVHYMCRILESLGLLPQNPNEYDPEHEMYWRNYHMTRFPEYEALKIGMDAESATQMLTQPEASTSSTV